MCPEAAPGRRAGHLPPPRLLKEPATSVSQDGFLLYEVGFWGKMGVDGVPEAPLVAEWGCHLLQRLS